MSAPAPIDELEARIRALPATLELKPEDHRAVRKLEVVEFRARQASVVRVARRPRLRRLAFSATTVVAAFVLLNLAAAYFAPAYGRALADAPGVGPISSRLLDFTGLGNGNLTFAHQSATASGHTVELVAGYADGLRTVLFVQVDGKGLTGDPKQFGRHRELGLNIESLSLTDQFGRSYGLSSGVQTDSVLTFDPLRWPAASVGGRLTLHVGALEDAGDPGTGIVKGDWTLHVTLFSEPVHTLPLPAPIHTDQAVYTFTLVRESGTTLIVHWTVTGRAIAEVNALWPVTSGDPNQKPGSPSPAWTKVMQDYFSTQLFDDAGKPMSMRDWGYEFSSPVKGSLDAYIPGPGRYRIQMGQATSDPSLQRWIVVP